MRQLPQKIFLLVSLFTALVIATAQADQLETVTNEAAGFTIEFPVGWRSVPLPTGLIGSAGERNERGQPVAMCNISQPDLGGKTFDTLFEEERSRAERMNKPGDEHQVATLEHAAGAAFRVTRRTTTSSGQVQVVHAVYLAAGGKVWLLNWTTPPSNDPEQLEELSLAVAKSFALR